MKYFGTSFALLASVLECLVVFTIATPAGSGYELGVSSAVGSGDKIDVTLEEVRLTDEGLMARWSSSPLLEGQPAYLVLQELGQDPTVPVHYSLASHEALVPAALKPGSSYEMKISIHSGDTRHTSRPHLFSLATRDVAVRDAEVVEVGGVRARIRWTTTGTCRPLVGKVTCLSHDQYKQTTVDLVCSTLSVSRSGGAVSSVSSLLLEGLLTNTSYICQLDIEDQDGRLVKPSAAELHFKTLLLRPISPLPPIVSMVTTDPTHEDQVSVLVRPSVSLTSSVRSYWLVAIPTHPVPWGNSVPVTALDGLMSKAVSAHLAAATPAIVPFLVAEFEPQLLPTTIQLNLSLGEPSSMAFKSSSYVFVTVVQGKPDTFSNQNTASPPSHPPLKINKDVFWSGFLEKQGLISLLVRVGLWTLVCVLLSALVVFSAAMLWIVCLRRTREQYRWRKLNYNEDWQGEQQQDTSLQVETKPGVEQEQPQQSPALHTSWPPLQSGCTLHNPVYSDEDPVVEPRWYSHREDSLPEWKANLLDSTALHTSPTSSPHAEPLNHITTKEGFFPMHRTPPVPWGRGSIDTPSLPHRQRAKVSGELFAQPIRLT